LAFDGVRRLMDADNYIDQEIGNYRLVEKLDCGSFGCVYRAEHLHLKKHMVAIKLLHAHLASHQKSDEFLQEAQFLYDLSHPHILPVLDVGIYEKKIPYLVVEYCPNGSLKQYLQRQHPGPLSVEEAVSILTKIGQALHHAHQHNIVHRDLKPANILFNAKGEVMLTDFGIAVLLEGTTFINPGGTPAYMAPEQFQGIVSKKSDQFALGCIAYELVTGQRPFLQSRTDPPIPPSALNPLVPSHIEQAILKALAKRHTDRHEDVVTFVNALEKTAQQWLDEGGTFHRLQKYDEALTAYEQAIRLDPNNAAAYNYKGVALHNLKRYDEALVAYERAIRLNPNDGFAALAYNNKGVTLHNLKRYDEALVAYEQAIRLDPNDAFAYHYKGVALDELKRYEEALAALDQAIRLDPNSATAYENKGFALMNLKRYEEALVALDQAIRLDPNSAIAYDNKGWALSALKRYEEALATCEQAIRLDPNFAKAYDRKGWILSALKRNVEAKQAYEKALQLG
jgi:serine/threonine protein kinase